MFNWLSLLAGLISAAAGISACRDQFQSTMPASAYVQTAPDTALDGNASGNVAAEARSVPQQPGDDSRVVSRLVVRAATAVESQVAGSLKLSNVEFLTNSTNFTRRGLKRLQRIATLLKTNIHARFQIAGHTDSRGNASANMALSEVRARVVIQYMIDADLPGDRFVARGFGETRPVADNGTAEGRQRNRRIEFMQLNGAEQ